MDYLFVTENGSRVVTGMVELENAVMDLRIETGFKLHRIYQIRDIKNNPREIHTRHITSGKRVHIWFEDIFGNRVEE